MTKIKKLTKLEFEKLGRIMFQIMKDEPFPEEITYENLPKEEQERISQEDFEFMQKCFS